MATNPQIAQGTLNRLRGSVVYSAFPALNVTAPYLGKAGITLALEGETTEFLPTMTGVVTSQAPYQMVGLTINLLKTQGLSNLYKAQFELSSLVGDVTVRPDTTTLGVYQLYNCALESVKELAFSGEDAGFVVSVKGYYLINSAMWNL